MSRILSVKILGLPRTAMRAVSSANTASSEAPPPTLGSSSSGGAGGSLGGSRAPLLLPRANSLPLGSAAAAGGCSDSAPAAFQSRHLASYDESGRLTLCLDSRNYTQLHITLGELGPLQTAVHGQMLRPSQRASSSARPWVLPFLLGSAASALGFAAYASTSPQHNGLLQARPLSLTECGGGGGGLAAGVNNGAGAWRGGLGAWPFSWARSEAEARAPAELQSSPHRPSPPPATAALVPTWGGVLDGVSSRPSPEEAAALAAAAAVARTSPLTRASITEASARAAPAVVHLVVTTEAQLGSVHGHKSSGSGFIYEASGYILTNAHVVAGAGEAGQLLAVTLQDGRVYRGVVTQLDKGADVAVVKIDSPEPLPVARLGRSAHLAVGEWVVALGSPLMLKHSVTAGIISCVERKGCELGLAAARTGYIQTDASVNQGNSGGPLINLDGEVIGINFMKAVAADGVSFAIPIDTVQAIVRQLSEHGRVIRPYVGITMLEVTNGGLTQLKQQVPALSLSQQAVVVQRVVPGSPAADAGLLSEDIIVACAGEEGLTMAQMVERFTAYIGKPLTLRLLRKAADGTYIPLLKTLHAVEAHPTP